MVSKKHLIPLLTMLCVLIGLFSACSFSWVQVTPTLSQKNGISPESAFVIDIKNLTEDITNPEKLIQISPENNFSLTKNDGGGFLLTPTTPFMAGEKVNITITHPTNGKQKTFSYSVENQLAIRSNFPINNSQRVPVDCGVEIQFNTSTVSMENFKDAFYISPDIPGEITSDGNRFVFYPTKQFAYGTKYTVNVDSKILSAQGGAKLSKSLSFSFTTITEAERNDDMFLSDGDNITLNTLTSDIPLVTFYISEEIPADKRLISVDIFKFNSWQDYKAQLDVLAAQKFNFSYLNVDTSKLEKQSHFETLAAEATQSNSYFSNKSLVQFPEALPDGWYVAEFSLNYNGAVVKQQLLIQSSDLSVFYLMSNDELLFWTNDASTGNAIENANIKVSGGYSSEGITDVSGTAVLDVTNSNSDSNSLNINNAIITVTSDDKVFVDRGYFYSDDIEPLSHNYITYLYTDREIYKPTDTVNVWGVIRPRFDNIKLPTDLTLSISDGSISVPVSPSADGTFTAKLSYKDIAATYSQSLALKSGEINLYDKSIRIEDYSKPVYISETSSNKPVYLLSVDNKPQISLDVSTYDGTPASGFNANFHSFGNIYSTQNTLTTNSNGKISTTISITDDLDTWIPQNYSFFFENADPQGENYYSYGSIYAIHRNVSLDAEAKSVGGKTVVDVTTNKLSLDKVKTSDDLFPLSKIKGEPIRREGTAYLHKVFYEKKADGTYYDYMTRTRKDLFHYIERDELIETRPFITENGKCSITNLPKADANACYYLELSIKDTGGRTVTQKVYLGFLEPYFSRWEDGSHKYDFSKMSNDTQSELNDLKTANSMYLYPHSMSSFKQDENVTFLLQDKSKPVEKFSGRMLYTVVQDKISDVTIVDKANFTLPFKQTLVPNYIITGAYFDGKHIYSIGDNYMNYNPEAQALNISLTSDKQIYSPASSATITATVTNAADNKPVGNTNLLLSVVDEAVFSLEQQTPEFLTKLYKAIYYPSITHYTSFVQNPYGDEGGMGGGGGDNASMRKYFPDTAQFITAKTDTNGKASFKFTLPDSITSWRATALAISKDNFAGDAKINLQTTKPYFVNPIVSEEMLSGDTFTVGLRSAGTAIDEDSISEYTAVVDGTGGFKKTLNTSSPSSEYACVTLDGLTTGDYTVTITAKCNNMTDVMRLPFKVIDTAIQVAHVKNFSLDQQPQLNAVSYPVNLSIYNKDYELHSKIISNIVSSDYGNRVDASLAEKYIEKMYDSQGVEWYGAHSTKHEPFVYDLLPVVINGDGNAELTAKALLSVSDIIHHANESYLNFMNYDNIEGRKSALYLCEATQNPKIATEITHKLTNDTTLDYTDKLILSTALAVCGETEQAQKQYDKLVLPNTASLTGISGEKAMYINIKDEAGKYYSTTAAASVLASVLQTNEADDLIRYLIEKKSATDPFIMEQLVYLSHCVDQKPSKASFSYVMNGKTITKEIIGSEACCLSFSKQQLEQANLKTLSGNVCANAYYYGTPPSNNTDKLIGLTKSIQPVEGDFETGKLVKITLTPDISTLDTDIGSFYMTLNDYIPTGMRFEKMITQNNNNYGWHLSNRQKQRVQFEIYGAKNEGGISPIEYYARLTAPGTYIVESGYITASDGDTWGSSPRSEITIKPSRVSHRN